MANTKILHISGPDCHGGAGRATYRIHDALLRAGCDSRIVCAEKRSEDERVRRIGTRRSNKFWRELDKAPSVLLRAKASRYWTNHWVPTRELEFGDGWQPEVAIVHALADGIASYRSLTRLRCPQIWWLHDFRPLTGGCHYPGGCVKFRSECHDCHLMRKTPLMDLARVNHRRLRSICQTVRPMMLATSQWLLDEFRASQWAGHAAGSVLVPNPVDVSVFQPADPRASRESLGLDPERPVVLFGAIEATKDTRKGFGVLKEAIALAACGIPGAPAGLQPQYVMFGAPQGTVECGGATIRSLGVIKDDVYLARAYSAADVLVMPSLEEAFGQTVTESLACGTPVCAFNSGGPASLVSHLRTGYLAKPFEAEDLARGFLHLCGPMRLQATRSACRAEAEARFSYSQVSSQLLTLCAAASDQWPSTQ